MRLSELATGVADPPGAADPEITGLTDDSRLVTPGMLFVAVPGTSLDGHAYISDALTRGAAAVVAERTGAVPEGTPVVRVPSSRRALAELAAAFHRHPAKDLSLIGFTGTFGKTSTSEILRELLEAGGIRTGVLGSLGARFRDFRVRTKLTTPAPADLHAALRGLTDAGATTVIMEVTSHALKLGRVEGLRFDGGLLAAIMPGEHTDFHRSYEDYVEAKRLFLEHLAPDARLAFDADNRAARRLALEARVPITAGFSIEGRDADLQIQDVLVDRRGATFRIAGLLAGADSGSRLHSALLGRGHLRNVALALAYALASGVSSSAARDVLASLEPLRRRMERYTVDGRTVLDDTAAHPGSLRETFDVAAKLPHESLAVVYALRGSRGAEINRANALALADLAFIHGVDPLIITAASDCAGPSDRARPQEIDAAREALIARGRRFVWHDRLDGALKDACDRTHAGDLIVLIGAQAMDEGKRLLQSSR
jgi:UDP-N-acetylmuramoyl-L-alanyl-D-glutamate--2,6-diaminopimelate ligase